MQLKDIKELIKVLEKSNLNELNIVDGEFEIHLQKDRNLETITMPQQYAAPAMAPAPAMTPAAIAPAAAPAELAAPVKSNLIEIKSPMVGTFYAASNPESPDFANIGDKINDESVVCIVEAMKLFNEIKAETSGKIVEILVENAQPVEYGQVLFLVEPA